MPMKVRDAIKLVEQDGWVSPAIEAPAAEFAACGAPAADVDVRIVDPATCRPCAPGQVGGTQPC